MYEGDASVVKKVCWENNVQGEIYFKMNSECKLVRDTLTFNGFTEVYQSKDPWALFWSAGMTKPFVFQNLWKGQKVNHFPRCGELTRKDSLCFRLTWMKDLFGARHFSFMPDSFVVPRDAKLIQAEAKQKKQLWIFKPAHLCQGKGIFIKSDLTEQDLSQNLIVSKYITNPLLINGFKFDLRIYVALTSISPFRLYRFKNGLVRFAWEPFSLEEEDATDLKRHLTNTSLAQDKDNKKWEMKYVFK